MNAGKDDKKNPKAQTGIPGLDEVLHGGLTRGAVHLVEGESGAGKTIVGLQFSLEGLRQGETVLYVALSETRKDIEEVARSHGWDIGKLQIQEALAWQEPSSSVFHPSEVELGQAMQGLKEAVERVKPTRLVIDSLAEFRILGQSSYRYRRELLALKRFLATRGCTVLVLDEPGPEDNPRTLVDGVLLLQQMPPEYGTDRRRLRMVKLRGRSYTGGFHDFTIRRGGLQVFPRLVAAEHPRARKAERLPSGLAELDALFGGGLQRGTSTLMAGPAGTGKSSIASLFAAGALGRGEAVLYFTFDERPELILLRARGLGLDLQSGLDSGRLHLRQVDPAELSPGEFAHLISQKVEALRGVSIVVIDSLNGYLHAMPDEKFLLTQMHELLSYLGLQGVSTFLVMGHVGLGLDLESPANTSYLTDNVLLLRYFESGGEIHRALTVLKQRSGFHEHSIHVLLFKPGAIRIGGPLRQFRGILSGTPDFIDLTDERSKDPNVRREPS